MNALAGSVPSRTRRRGRLSLREKVELGGEILGAYGRTRYALRRHETLPEALESLRAQPTNRSAEDTTALETGFRLGKAVTRTLAIIPTDSRCLMRSLVLIVLLSRRGISGDLVIGVKSDDGTFAAHAWVEHGGRPLLPPGTEFTRLAEL